MEGRGSSERVIWNPIGATAGLSKGAAKYHNDDYDNWHFLLTKLIFDGFFPKREKIRRGENVLKGIVSSQHPAPAGEWNGGEVVIRNEWQDWRRFRLRRKCKSCGIWEMLHRHEQGQNQVKNSLWLSIYGQVYFTSLGMLLVLVQKAERWEWQENEFLKYLSRFLLLGGGEELKKKRWREQVKTEDHFSSQIDKLFLSLLVWVRHPLLLPLCGGFWAETERRERNSTVRMKDGLGNFNWVDLKGLGATQ